MSRRIVRSVTSHASASCAEPVKRPASIVFRIFHCRMTSAFLMAGSSGRGILARFAPCYTPGRFTPEDPMPDRAPRLGDVIDDYCPRCRLLLNHDVTSLFEQTVAKVTCRTCHNAHDYRNAQVPTKRRVARKEDKRTR